MVRFTLPDPGTPDGPCRDCHHPACHVVRALAVLHCRYCHEPMGSGTLFVWQNKEFVHLACQSHHEISSGQKQPPQEIEEVGSRELF